MSAVTGISLLWPHGEPTSTPHHWQETSVVDIGLDSIVSAFNIDGKHDRAIKEIFLSLCEDVETIRYRQEILADLLDNPQLVQQFHDLLPLLADLAQYSSLTGSEGLPFQKTLSRLGELELYAQVVKTFYTVLHSVELHSTGLLALRDLLQQRIQDPLFQQIERELPAIVATTRGLASITLGINLDHNLHPIAATIVSINTEPFRGSSMLNKLFGSRDEFQGISQLHTVPMKSVETFDGRLIPTGTRTDPLLHPLFKDLDRIITDTMRPIADALKRFLHVCSQFLTTLEPELVFYLGAVRLIGRLTAQGLPLCRAEIADKESRLCLIRDCYNLHLALRIMVRQDETSLAAEIVRNDVALDDHARICIITGPNQGGKTTYIQALAIAQVLFQAGLYVPGTQAQISPVDGIYTHFPVEEKPNAEAGRFGEEAQRLGEIFSWATPYSLILLNESLASTASSESFYLAYDVVRCLRLLGVRAAYTTHMHELAASVDELNAMTPGTSKVISLVAVAQTDPALTAPDAVRRTYKIVAGPPMGRSYARDLATRYGISFEKIIEKLSSRGTIDPRVVDSLTGQ